MTPYITIPAWLIPLGFTVVLLAACYAEWRNMDGWFNFANSVTPPPTKADRVKLILLAVFSVAVTWTVYIACVVVWWNNGGGL